MQRSTNTAFRRIKPVGSGTRLVQDCSPGTGDVAGQTAVSLVNWPAGGRCVGGEKTKGLVSLSGGAWSVTVARGDSQDRSGGGAGSCCKHIPKSQRPGAGFDWRMEIRH